MNFSLCTKLLTESPISLDAETFVMCPGQSEVRLVASPPPFSVLGP